MNALRARASLDTVGIDRTSAGRPTITESQESVWDFLPMTLASAEAEFAQFPHFAVSI